MSGNRTSQLAHQAEQIRRTEVLTRFVHGLSHDYNNLLAAIMNNAATLGCGLPPDSPLRPALNRLTQAARIATDLTGRIQAYTETSTAPFEPLSLSILVGRLLPALQAEVLPPAALRLEADPDLPMIPLARQLVECALRNLVTNAVEAMAGEPGTVTVRTESVDGQAVDPRDCLLVENLRPTRYSVLGVGNDIGPALTDTLREHMFEPYFSTRIRGPGLGLCAVLGMARTHRAVIHLPPHATGCTVRILFP